MNKEEYEKITEVEGLPKDEKEYMERLLKKEPWFMNLEEQLKQCVYLLDELEGDD